MNIKKLINKFNLEINLNNIGNALEIGKDLEKKLSDNLSFLFTMGSLYINVKDYPNSIKFLNKAEKLDTQNTDVLIQLGNAHALNNDSQRAIEYFNKSQNIRKNFDVMVGLSIEYTKIKDYDNAINIYRELYEIEFYRKIISFNYALVLHKKKESLHALKVIKYLISHNEINSNLFKLKADIEKSVGRIYSASISYEKAILMDDNDLNTYDNISEIYSQVKRFKDCEVLLSKKLNELYDPIIALNLLHIYTFTQSKNKISELFNEIVRRNDPKCIVESLLLLMREDFEIPSDLIKKIKNYFNTNSDKEYKNLMDIFEILYPFFNLNEPLNLDLLYNYRNDFFKKEKKSSQDFLKLLNHKEIIPLNNINKSIDNEPNHIFIIGLPRSGSTIIEQSLCSYSQVETINENPYFIAIKKLLAEEQKLGSLDFFNEIKNNYCFEINGIIKNIRNTKFVVNKDLFNFTNVELITKIIPDSKFIVCHRDFSESFLSSLVSFDNKLPFLMDYDSYIECCEIFLKKLTEIINNKNIEIYFIEHKKLLSEYKATIKNLINWLGIDSNNKLLKSSENVEIVTTASKNQLKKNINKQNSKNWNDIKKQLPESFMTKIQELNNNFNKLINHKK